MPYLTAELQSKYQFIYTNFLNLEISPKAYSQSFILNNMGVSSANFCFHSFYFHLQSVSFPSYLNNKIQLDHNEKIITIEKTKKYEEFTGTLEELDSLILPFSRVMKNDADKEMKVQNQHNTRSAKKQNQNNLTLIPVEGYGQSLDMLIMDQI